MKAAVLITCFALTALTACSPRSASPSKTTPPRPTPEQRLTAAYSAVGDPALNRELFVKNKMAEYQKAKDKELWLREIEAAEAALTRFSAGHKLTEKQMILARSFLYDGQEASDKLNAQIPPKNIGGLTTDDMTDLVKLFKEETQKRGFSLKSET